MLTGPRLLLKSIRFELGAVVLGAALLAGAALVVTYRLDSIGLPRDCLYEVSGAPAIDPTSAEAEHDAGCASKRDAFYGMVNSDADGVLAMMAGFPLIAGLLVGVPLVGREIEWGTAPLAWTLARSRRRWLLARAVPVGLILGLVLAMPAIAAFVLEGAAEPAVDPGASFQDFGLRGAPIVARGLLAYGIAVLAGTIMGRQLPALIVAGVLTVGAFSVADMEQGAIVRSRPTVSIPGGDAELPVGVQWITQLVRGPDDTLQQQSHEQIFGGSDVVDIIVPGSEYPVVAAIYSAMLAGVAVLLLGVSVEVVERRRAT